MKKLFLITSIFLLSILLFGCRKVTWREILLKEGFSETDIDNIFEIKSETFHLNHDTKADHQSGLAEENIDDIILNLKKKNEIENKKPIFMMKSQVIFMKYRFIFNMITR